MKAAGGTGKRGNKDCLLRACGLLVAAGLLPGLLSCGPVVVAAEPPPAQAAGCAVDADCPGEGPCRPGVCVAHACTHRSWIAGTLLVDEHPGDCKIQVCGAEGAVEEREAPADAPAQTDPCWQPICRGDLPDHAPSPPGTPCAEEGLCFRDGVCRKVRQITAGERFSCALLSDGTASCWGEGIERPNSHEYNLILPLPWPNRGALPQRILQLSLWGDWAYSLTEKDEIWLWNRTQWPRSSESSPARVFAEGLQQGLSGTVALAGSEWMGCALDSAGAVRCWANRSEIVESVLIPLSGRALSIAGSDSRVCALLASGAVRCWDEGAVDQVVSHQQWARSVGAAAKPAQRVPTVGVGQVEGATSLAIGLLSYCVTRANASVWCWGGRRRRRAGDEESLEIPAPGEIIPGSKEQDIRKPRRIEGLGGVISIVANSHTVCALQRGGATFCWGKLSNLLAPDSPIPSSPQALPAFAGVASLALGENFLCALRHDSVVICAGSNLRGQPGLGKLDDTSARLIPF